MIWERHLRGGLWVFNPRTEDAHHRKLVVVESSPVTYEQHHFGDRSSGKTDSTPTFTPRVLMSHGMLFILGRNNDAKSEQLRVCRAVINSGPDLLRTFWGPYNGQSSIQGVTLRSIPTTSFWSTLYIPPLP